jgi:glycosyltransferase involved in cell wall biosynthesis
MKIAIDYHCFLNSSGYSQAAQDTIWAMEKSGHFDVRVTCLHRQPIKNAFSKSSLQFFSTLCSKPSKPNAIQIFHCIPEKQTKFRKLAKSVSFATYETFEPPAQWITSLNRMDAVICPSSFNYRIFAHAGIKKPLFHIPHGLDTEKWNCNVVPITKHREFTFLFVGTWRKRKGWENLVQAWLQEFSPRDNVKLLIHTDKADRASKDILAIKKNLGVEKKENAPIIVEDTVVDDLSLPSFFKSANCLVAPSLGEGFGLPALQCMALKVPVITTNFGGSNDYASDETCTLLEPVGFMVHDCMDNIPQFRNRKWPRVTVQSIRSAMRSVLEGGPQIYSKVEDAYSNVQSNFCNQVVVDKFLELMEMVYSVRQTTTQTV